MISPFGNSTFACSKADTVIAIFLFSYIIRTIASIYFYIPYLLRFKQLERSHANTNKFYVILFDKKGSQIRYLAAFL
jgi:hypothetical protein